MKEEDFLKQDDNLQQLFDDFHPTLSDNDQFMQSLSNKLDAIDYITQRQLAQKRCYRRTLVITLVAGIVGGGLLTAFALLYLQPGSLFTLTLQADLSKFIHENLVAISLTVGTLLLSGILIATANFVLEVFSYRSPVKKMKNEVKSEPLTPDNFF